MRAIDADRLKEHIDKLPALPDGNFAGNHSALKALINMQPTVEPERKTGKWLLTIEDWNKWTCSECGFSKRTDIHVTLGYDYCPKCGVKMEVDG